MPSTSTINEMIVKLFGERCLDSFDQVDVITTSANENSAITLDELGNNYLGEKVASTFPDIDLKEERVGIQFSIRELNLRMSMQGLSLVLTIVFLASLILGSSVVLAMLQTVAR